MQLRCKPNDHRTSPVQASRLRELVLLGPVVPQIGDLVHPPGSRPVVVRDIQPLTRRDGCSLDPILVLVA